MKGRLLSVAACVTILLHMPFGLVGSQEHPATPGAAAILPASLDAHYPPASKGPAYVVAMYDMNTPLAGMVADLLDDDIQGVQTNYEAFRVKYAEVAGLVPEWKDRYPQAPVDELGAAVQAGDPGAVMGAVEKVGAVCHSCHVAYMVPAQQKYHWPSFKMVSVRDPLSGQDVGYPALMQFLNVNFSAMATNLAQGQQENAKKQLQAFRARFATLRESCDACHDSKRTYFVDEQIETMLDQLASALDAQSIDPGTVAGLSQKIGTQSCTACHLVHMPAAYAGLAMP